MITLDKFTLDIAIFIGEILVRLIGPTENNNKPTKIINVMLVVANNNIQEYIIKHTMRHTESDRRKAMFGFDPFKK